MRRIIISIIFVFALTSPTTSFAWEHLIDDAVDAAVDVTETVVRGRRDVQRDNRKYEYDYANKIDRIKSRCNQRAFRIRDRYDGARERNKIAALKRECDYKLRKASRNVDYNIENRRDRYEQRKIGAIADGVGDVAREAASPLYNF